jgi:mono/diheme cytochrome c family protein
MAGKGGSPSAARYLITWLATVTIALIVGIVTGGSASAEDNSPGARIYKQSGCIVCHGGFGTGGFGPKLAGDPMLAIGQFVIAQILIGRGQMPPFADKLSDQDIAAVAQYIRTNWGNDFGPVAPDQAADTRNLMKRAMETAARVSQAEQ